MLNEAKTGAMTAMSLTVSAVSKACTHSGHQHTLCHLSSLNVRNTMTCSPVGVRLENCNNYCMERRDERWRNFNGCRTQWFEWFYNSLEKHTLSHSSILSPSRLSIKHRITYKIAVIAYKIRATSLPHCLNTLLLLQVTGTRMTLRSASHVRAP